LSLPLHQLVEERLLPMATMEPSGARSNLARTWRELSQLECFLFHKMLTGGLRVGVARTLLSRALAETAGVEPAVMAHRLMGGIQPDEATFERLMAAGSVEDDATRPYPFYLAYALEKEPVELGPVDDWQIERKWDGIRAQLVKRSGEVLIWSRGEELVTDSFPEVAGVAAALPDGTVLDGELLAWRNGPLGFSRLQRRLGRSNPSARQQRENPIAFMGYDLLEAEGTDLRKRAMHERRQRLESLMEDFMRQAGGLVQPAHASQLEMFPESDVQDSLPILLSEVLDTRDWKEVAREVEDSRRLGVEGVMLKRRGSSYGVGREKGHWWKWKMDPLTIDAVMVAAQLGHGRRANLYTDYTFALWDGEELVTVAKAYSGLTDEEFSKVDRFVRENTLKRHGPVRSVKPELVFEIAFEGIQSSSRHKSGVAVRFPRIHRQREDKAPSEADTLANLKALAREGKRD